MPNRIIKESIRTSKTVNAMTDFQFRLWAYLITYVDDYGRGSADPELLKGFVFPRRKRVSESDIQKTLAELAGLGCIHLYEIDGESYFCFPNWGSHQRIQTKRSKFPEPPEPTVDHGEPPPESNPNLNLNPNSNPNPKVSGVPPVATATTDTRHKRGAFGWVKLTDAEYNRIISEFGEETALHYIAYVDESAEQTGNKNKWKNWNLTVRKAIKNRWGGGIASPTTQSGIDWSGFND